jgi:hypothetical protein
MSNRRLLRALIGLLLFAAACATPAPRPDRPDPAKAAADGRRARVPDVLYHFGQRQHLVEDARADTIPETVWNTIVMGGASKNRLHPFRRGLYGTTHPAFADNFGPWFMAVRVKEACRRPEAVAVPSTLHRDARFERWLDSTPDRPFRDPSEFSARCHRAASPPEEAAGRLFLSVQNVVGEEEPKEGPCERALQRLYDDAGVKLVLDEAWLEQRYIGINLLTRVSWYLRDRSCIDRIDGEVADIVPMLASVADLWDEQPVPRVETSDSPRITVSSDALETAGPLKMLLVALVESPQTASDEDLTTIRAAALDGTRPLEPLGTNAREAVPPLIDAFLRCRSRSDLVSFQQAVPSGDFPMTELARAIERLREVCLESDRALGLRP